MNVGSLFSGIGGLDLGLERAGMTVIWQSEIDLYASRVLAKHWPNVPNLGDITTIDWSTVERPDLICGGYPCQPFSLAGRRAGADDSRHLWPHMLRAIRELRPRFALLENVPGHLSMGFGRVLGDLAESGYNVEWDCIPAASVGAPHRRDRVFGIAHDTTRFRRWRQERSDRRVPRLVPDAECDELRIKPIGLRRGSRPTVVRDDGASQPVADTEGKRRCRGEFSRAHLVDNRPQSPHSHAGTGGDAGWWAVEPSVGRVAHGVPSRVDRLRCLGNAVVPQVAEWIGRRIMETTA